jgi:hypothetical protein
MKKIAQAWTGILSITIIAGFGVATFSEVLEYRLMGSALLLMGGYLYGLGITFKKSVNGKSN